MSFLLTYSQDPDNYSCTFAASIFSLHPSTQFGSSPALRHSSTKHTQALEYTLTVSPCSLLDASIPLPTTEDKMLTLQQDTFNFHNQYSSLANQRRGTLMRVLCPEPGTLEQADLRPPPHMLNPLLGGCFHSYKHDETQVKWLSLGF